MNAVSFVRVSVFSALLGLAGAASASYNDGFLAAESGDYKTAITYWGPLAEQGHPFAQFNLGMLYHSGDGVAHNEAEAIAWYTKAAENGYYKAQEYLAAGYAEGWFGLKKDAKKSQYWTNRIDTGN
jgi:TPR repeat protein